MQTKSFKIEFAFDDLADVVPWGEGDQASLSWFGLTQGRYWIETPAGDLLRYTPEIQEHWKSPCAVVDYQVARFFEDLLDRMPAILEPVPHDIANKYGDRAWHERLRRWTEEETAADQPRWAQPPDRWDLYEAAMHWWCARTLDTAYLLCGPAITIWRADNDVHLRWTSERNRIDGIEVFANANGDVTVPAGIFERAAITFLKSVISAMGERIHMLKNGAQTRPCRLDIAALSAEQAQREDELRLKLVPTRTDWSQIRTHLDVLSSALNAT